MITNPGGQLALDEIIGRDSFITEMWRILAGRCVYMNDLRRIGKTQIMVKMEAQPPEGWVCLKRDLGGSHTADEFAARIYTDSASALTGGRNAMRQMSKLLGAVAGTEIAGIIKLPDGTTAPWKEVLTRTFTDIHQEMEKQDQRLLFLWDEVPFLLANLAKREGPEVAMEVLDVLRSLSQDYDRVRLLLTGSIGLHHILKQLHEEGYGGSPLNRMELVKPGPLEPSDAEDLAKLLLQGEKFDCDNLAQCAATVAASVGHVPFYIHKLINRLPRDEKISSESIQDQLSVEISSCEGDWDLEHYQQRIDKYYGRENKELALTVLDSIAINEGLPFESIERQVVGQLSCDTESLRKLIALLCRDHYLDRDIEGRYHFYLEIVRRWWVLSRDLQEAQG